MLNNNIFEITWLPLWDCNFRCRYCLGWYNTNALKFQPLNTIIKMWDIFLGKIMNSETDVNLTISGGEPTIYPNIFQFLQHLINKYPNIHVSLCTNLSFNAVEFLKFNFQDNRIALNATFHPSCMSTENFVENLILLKKYIPYGTVNFVADETNLKKQQDFIKSINDCGIKLNPLFFKSFRHEQETEYGNLEVLNSEDEINLVKKIKSEQNLDSSDYESTKQSSFGKKCTAGYRYIQIFPNGNIRKCSMDSTYLGNIFDEDLNLYQEPQRCKQKICPHQYHNIIED